MTHHIYNYYYCNPWQPDIHYTTMDDVINNVAELLGCGAKYKIIDFSAKFAGYPGMTAWDCNITIQILDNGHNYSMTFSVYKMLDL